MPLPAMTPEQQAQYAVWVKQQTFAPPVTLAPAQENHFQSWVKELPWYSEFKANYGGEPNLDDPQYNYRAAWLAGVKPGIDPESLTWHWPDSAPNGHILKSREHPTLYMEFLSRQQKQAAGR